MRRMTTSAWIEDSSVISVRGIPDRADRFVVGIDSDQLTTTLNLFGSRSSLRRLGQIILEFFGTDEEEE